MFVCMSVICWSKDPSSPANPGGVSLTREWSLQGGAAVMSIMCVVSYCAAIAWQKVSKFVSAMSPMCWMCGW